MKYSACFAMMLIGLLLNVNVKAQSLQFVFQGVGTNAQIETAFDSAAAQWSRHLASSVPVKVKLVYANWGLPAVTFPNVKKDFPNAPLSNVWYPTALANSLAAQELNPGEDDMTIFISSYHTWYTGTDGNTPADAYDLETYLIREIGRGLGFTTFIKLQGTDSASIGMVTSADFDVFDPGFSYPNLQGLHSVFSYHLHTSAGEYLHNTLVFPNPSDALLDIATGNDVYFSGPYTLVQTDGIPLKIFAGEVFQHYGNLNFLDEETFFAGTPGSIMTPHLQFGESTHDISLTVLGVMKDLGWNVNNLFVNSTSNHSMKVFPNPAEHEICIQLNDDSMESITIIDLTGKLIRKISCIDSANTEWRVDISDLSPGMYFISTGKGYLPFIRK